MMWIRKPKTEIRRRWLAVGLAACVFSLSVGWWLSRPVFAANGPTTARLCRPLPAVVNSTKIDLVSAGSPLELLAAVASTPIQVWACELNVSVVSTVDFKSGTTSFTGPQSINYIIKDFPVGRAGIDTAPAWKETAAGAAFNVDLATSGCRITGELLWTAVK